MCVHDVTNKAIQFIITFLVMEEERKLSRTNERCTKGITMVWWTHYNWNNSFANLKWLPLLCEISEAVLLVLVGVMAG